jgi:hypothetical protein
VRNPGETLPEERRFKADASGLRGGCLLVLKIGWTNGVLPGNLRTFQSSEMQPDEPEGLNFPSDSDSASVGKG